VARFGPLFRSFRELVPGLDAEELRRLPGPPMPVQLAMDENDSITISLLVTLPAEDHVSQERALGNLADHGFHVTTWTGRVAAGYANVRDADALEKVEGDLYIEAAHAVHPELDVSVPEAWNLPAGWFGHRPGGSNILIGIVDVGIDPAHPSLRTSSGATRITKLWDQTKSGAAPPPAGYRYGSEWDSAAIDAFLALAASAKLPVKVAQHGTAVAGVAVSNGLCPPTGQYVGVAPAAAGDVLSASAYCLAPGLGTFADLSSRGPDRLGRALAGLAAPGKPVTSCMAAPFYPATAHTADSGTSYAAAHVAGAIAVLLQAQPTLTRKQVLDCLLTNARTDINTATGRANGWGAGKLDIHAALRCAIQHQV
jgi:subtilisin family serine protease